MNILKKIRNPIFAIYASIFMLFFSCSQYEIRNEIVESAFDSELYDAFKKGDIELFVNNNSNTKKSLENSKNLLTKINKHYGTDLKIPDNFFQLFLDRNIDKNVILETSLKEGWLNKNDINLTNELIENINSKGYNSAIDVFKNQTLKLNLSEEEFSKKNTFINVLEIMHDENPSFFETNYLQKGGWGCFWAVAFFIVAVISMVSCVTWVLCGFAAYGLMEASDNLVERCN
jgi:hypothetical protein